MRIKSFDTKLKYYEKNHSKVKLKNKAMWFDFILAL